MQKAENKRNLQVIIMAKIFTISFYSFAFATMQNPDYYLASTFLTKIKDFQTSEIPPTNFYKNAIFSNMKQGGVTFRQWNNKSDAIMQKIIISSSSFPHRISSQGYRNQSAWKGLIFWIYSINYLCRREEVENNATFYLHHSEIWLER